MSVIIKIKAAFRSSVHPVVKYTILLLLLNCEIIILGYFETVNMDGCMEGGFLIVF
jgi:hypothetical protein